MYDNYKKTTIMVDNNFKKNYNYYQHAPYAMAGLSSTGHFYLLHMYQTVTEICSVTHQIALIK